MRTPAEKAEIRARFEAVDTSNIADVLDRLGHPDQGLAPDFAALSGSRVAGWAYTLRGQMRPSGGSGDPAKMEACQSVGPDEVTVWAGDGHGVGYFGELIALGMQERGCVGAVVDGGVRDLRWLRQHDFPVFARYRTPVQSIGRWSVTDWQQPVFISGATARWVQVKPGDFIVGDEDGAIVVPEAVVDRVLVAAEELTATEVSVRAALRDGLTLSECLAKFGHV